MQALCAEELCTMEKGVKGVVTGQLCLERQLKGVIVTKPIHTLQLNKKEF